MRPPRSYIVRVYRRSYRSLSGIVEDAETGQRAAFRNIDELFVLLRDPARPKRSTGPTPHRTDSGE